MIWLFWACTGVSVDDSKEPIEEAAIPCEGDGVPISTTTGCVVGVEHQGAELFLGIPYAEPPIGDLRWKRTVPVQPWSAPFSADTLSSACVQMDDNGSVWGAEDCLTLNVFRPAEAQSSEPLPILFFIHGGSFTSGVGSYDVYERLPELAKEAILVTYNYRLGSLGFLAHDDLTQEDASDQNGAGTSGNVALFDTMEALQWVANNAEAFGGDPSQLMVFGVSSGAVLSCLLLTTPESEGLFSSAIIQSGTCNNISMTLSTAEEYGSEFASALGCDDDSLNCLRSASVNDIMTVDTSTFSTSGSFTPNVDGVLVPDYPGMLFYTGAFHNVTVVAGVTANEGSVFTNSMGLETAEELTEMLTDWAGFVGVSDVDTLLSLYTIEEHGGAQMAFDQFYGDVVFVCPTKSFLNMSSYHTPTYGYYYSHEPSWLSFYPELSEWGAFHASEVQFVFGLDQQYLTPAEQEMSTQLRGLWRAVAAGENLGSYDWQVYREMNATQFDSEYWLELKTGEFGSLSDVRPDRCDFFFTQWFGE